tara:strand:- start:2613 stop:3626 length:1014 start_codon:yes stop_codon:yes gene_type:complete
MRIAEVRQESERKRACVYTFEEAGLRYLDEIAHKPTAPKNAAHLDQLFPFIGDKMLEQVHDGTLKPFIDHELERGLSPKSINNVIGVVSAVLNRAARVWRGEDGRPWLCQAPPRLTRLSLKGKQAKAYPLSWDEQDKMFRLLPRHMAEAALFTVNTGLRDQEVCNLRWNWEIEVRDLETHLFVLPESNTKTNTERVVVLNRIASQVINAQRGNHPEFVFTYQGRPLARLHNSAWKRAWKNAGFPMDDGVVKGVHNLRHTFGRRLRGAGVSLETRKALLGHAHGDITTHYSAAELNELLQAAEKIVDRGIAQTPTLTVIRREKNFVGKLSEKEKGLAS